MSDKDQEKSANAPETPNVKAESTPVVVKEKPSPLTLIIMIVCIVASAVGILFYAFKTEPNEKKTNTYDSESVLGNLIDGQEYLIYLKSVEVQPQMANGDAWDTGNGAPDVFYRVVWQKNQIYESDTMKDSLIADWIPIGLSLKDSILNGQVSVDQAVKIPKVKYDSKISGSDEVIFIVIDADTFSGNDPIEDLSLLLSKLRVGDNVFDFREVAGHSLVKAVVRVIDNSLSTDEKIQALMRGQ